MTCKSKKPRTAIHPVKYEMEYLGIDSKYLQEITGISMRTAYRWINHGAPVYVLMLLRAWIKLEECGLAWKPNSIDVELSENGIREITSREARKRIRRGVL